jgi:hypothetical protein
MRTVVVTGHGGPEVLQVHAALDADDVALDAFSRWRSAVDFDRIDGGSMRLLPLVVDNLGPSLGDDDVAGQPGGSRSTPGRMFSRPSA